LWSENLGFGKGWEVGLGWMGLRIGMEDWIRGRDVSKRGVIIG
jgi:hypothetical protein